MMSAFAELIHGVQETRKLVTPASDASSNLEMIEASLTEMHKAYCEQTAPGFEPVEIEQLRDIYCGRDTYDSTAEWIANLDAVMAELCDAAGLSFAPQEFAFVTPPSLPVQS